MMYLMGVWIVIVLIKLTQSENYCDPGSKNHNNTITKFFEKPTENLECTPKNEHSVAMKLYHCRSVDKGEILVNCNRTQSPGIRPIASCSVTIDEENVLHTFYCTEHMFNDEIGRLSTHYNITFVPSTHTANISVDASSTASMSDSATTNNYTTPNIDQRPTDSNITQGNGVRSENSMPGMVVIVVLISILTTVTKCSDGVTDNSSSYI